MSHRPRFYAISGLVLQLDPYYLAGLEEDGRRAATTVMSAAPDIETSVEALEHALDLSVIGRRRVSPVPRVYTVSEREVVRLSAHDGVRPEVFGVDGGSVMVVDATFLEDVVRWFGHDRLPERVALATEARLGVEVHGPPFTTLRGRAGMPFAGDDEYALTERALRPGAAKTRGFREELRRNT